MWVLRVSSRPSQWQHLRSVATLTLSSRYERLVTQSNFRSSEAQVACLERLERLRSEMASSSASSRSSRAGSAPRGVYIYGDPGGGKTMMLDLFHEVLLESGVPSKRAHFHDFMLEVNRELHRLRKEVGSMADPLRLVAESFLQKSPLLCFDECHVLNVGDAMIMRAFFERLFAAGGTVVATSNLAPDKLYSSGINREVFQPFIDAVLQHCDAVHLRAGEDFRTSRSAALAAANGARSFFWPLGQEAEDQLRATLTEVRRGCPAQPVAQEVPVPMGRTLPCRRVWLQGVTAAEFSFQELCTAFVGVNDYIALAERFDVLVVTGVPRFESSQEDSARRFASLVDVLYDRRKRLLCTIDAPPREVFASIRAQYDGGIDDDLAAASQAKSAIAVPKHGGSSGRHVSAFRLPQGQLRYSESGKYGVAAADSESSAPPQEDTWVEWSATGLKDASMFDLTCHTSTQKHDRLLPLIRCESRLEEMSFLQ